MTKSRIVDYPTMSAPAVYRIRVRGHLDAGLSDRLVGMHIENLTCSDGKTESVLEGRLLDQAALSGVLNKLYELHLPVMSVDCLGSSSDEFSEEDK
jgi:hypothetical protein